MTKKNIVILGGGESGVGAAVLAKQKGFNVLLSDKNKIKDKYKNVLSQFDIEFEEGNHSENLILEADEVVKSPGIPDSIPLIHLIKEKGIDVISEIEFAGRYTQAKKICITGTNGKTTTALLTCHILKKAGLNVGLAGNIGQSFSWQVANYNYDYYVLEISSFQLDGMFEFKADLAILTNITPDHLDRYDNNFQNYIDSKFRIIQNQTRKNAFIYCADDEVITNELTKRKIKAQRYPFSIHPQFGKEGAYITGTELLINIKPGILKMSIEKLALQGRHNFYNSMAAGIASKIFEIRKETIRESLSDFQNVEHRLEFVTKIHGIDFINDSKATNINSAWFALESMTKKVIWIVGGVDKGNDWLKLKELVKAKVKAIVCLGVDNHKIHETFGKEIKTILDTRTSLDAVQAAYYLGEQGDVILLSPACASFDLFENFEDRGNQFKKAIQEL